MKNIFKNKLFIILIILITLIGSISTCCFADFNFNYNNISYSLSDLPTSNGYFVIGFSSRNSINNPCYVYVTSSEEMFFTSPQSFKCTSSVQTYLLDFNLYGDNNWHSYDSFNSGSWSTWQTLVLNNILYSNYNIKDKNGSLVFQVAPQVPEITKTLVEQSTKVQIMEQLQATIIGFLKYLIVFVVSVLAFWKGWKFLFKQFKMA